MEERVKLLTLQDLSKFTTARRRVGTAIGCKPCEFAAFLVRTKDRHW